MKSRTGRRLRTPARSKRIDERPAHPLRSVRAKEAEFTPWSGPAARINPMTLPKISVSEQLAAAFSRMSPTLTLAVTRMCDAVLMDVAGLCVAARHSDYLRAAVRSAAEPGACTLIGHAGGFSVATAALCNGTAAHGEDYDDTFEGGPVHAGAVIIPSVLAAAEQHVLAGGDVAPRPHR